MGIKLPLAPLGNPSTPSFITDLNARLAAISDEIDKFHYRDGSQSAQSDWNLNSRRIYNLPFPVNGTEPIRLQDASLINKGDKGDPGGLITSIGLFNTASTLTIPVGIDLVGSSGYSAVGVGNATYAYDAAVNAAYVIANPTTSFVSLNGRGFKLASDSVFLAMFGAVPATSVNTALAAADAWCVANNKPLYIAKAFTLAANITVASDVFFVGGVLTVNTGVLGTFTGTVVSPLKQIFNCVGTGAVSLNRMKMPVSYPEWWGAVGNNGGVDSLAPIMAARTAHGNVELQATDYYISAMLIHDQQFTRIAGKGMFYTSAPGQGTRLLVSGGTATCIQVGPTTFPGSINAMPQGIELENIHCSRTIAPVKGTTATSVRIQYTLNARVDRVRGAESIYGIHIFGNVAPNLTDCRAVRASIGTGAAVDQWRGFYVDGSAAIGAAGGNASVYLRYCVSATNTPISDSANFYIDTNFTDCFIFNPETVSGSYGIYVLGTGTSTTATTNRDLIIEHPVCDQHTTACIRISGINRSGSVEITNPYVGPSPGATAGIYIDSCPGTVNVGGGQLDMSAAPGVPGVLIVTTDGTVVDQTIIHDCTVNALAASGVTNFILRPQTENQSATSNGAAVQLSGTCVNGKAAPVVRGQPGKMPIGVQLIGALHSKVDIDTTGIDSTVTSSGLVTINAVAATARGDYTGAGVASPTGTINLSGQSLTAPVALYTGVNQVVGARGAAVADAVAAVAAPTQAEFNALVTQFNTLAARLRVATGHGLIA